MTSAVASVLFTPALLVERSHLAPDAHGRRAGELLPRALYKLMSRKPTGFVYQKNGKWIARITHPDGKRPRYTIGNVGEMNEARANEVAAAMSERVR